MVDTSKKGATTGATQQHDDEKGLEGLGYQQEMKREFTFWSAISVGFASISPIVAMYGVFALALAAAGPIMFWGLFVVLGGQALVALTLSEIAGRFPLAGGVYQWTRQLVGAKVAWFGGWAYMWTAVIVMTSCSYAAATFTLSALGLEPSKLILVFLSFAWILLGTVLNAVGRRPLNIFLGLAVIAELVASIGLGLVLIIGYRVNPISTLWQSYTTGDVGTFNWWAVAFLGAIAFIGWSFVGFECPGAVAEEVKDPERTVPRSIWMGLVFVGVVVIFTNFAWILSIPDIQAAMTGGVADPMIQTLEHHIGSLVTKPILVVIAIGFTASMMASQTACSRTLFSLARDKMIPKHEYFRHLSAGEKLPVRAIILAACAALCLLSVNLITEKVYATLTLFGIAGFYISFFIPVASVVWARMKRRFTPSEKWNLRGFGGVISAAAAIWLIFEIINVAWPRASEGAPWYSVWGTAIMVGIIALLGVITYLVTKHTNADVAQALESPPAPSTPENN